MNSFKFLYFIFFTVFFTGLFHRLGVNLFLIKLTIECSILLLLFNTIFLSKGRKFYYPGLLLLAGYLGFSLISTVYSGSSPYRSFLYVRYTLFAYIIFIAVWNNAYSIQQVKSINRFISLLFIVQILVTLHKLFILRGRWEGIVGTISITGGGIATCFSLLAFGYALGIYLFYDKKPRYLLMAFSFILIAYASTKRGIFFYLPLLMIASYLYYCFFQKKKIIGNVKILFAMVLLTSAVVYYGVTTTHSLNSQRSLSGGTFSTSYLIGYTASYSGGVNSSNETMGRFSSTMRAVIFLIDDRYNRWWCGLGPDTLYFTSTQVREMDIIYGITGLIREVISIGFFGAFIYFFFYVYFGVLLFRYVKSEHDPYWRALAYGNLLATITFLFMFITYNASFATSGVACFIYFYFNAIILSPNHQRVRKKEHDIKVRKTTSSVVVICRKKKLKFRT